MISTEYQATLLALVDETLTPCPDEDSGPDHRQEVFGDDVLRDCSQCSGTGYLHPAPARDLAERVRGAASETCPLRFNPHGPGVHPSMACPRCHGTGRKARSILDDGAMVGRLRQAAWEWRQDSKEVPEGTMPWITMEILEHYYALMDAVTDEEGLMRAIELQQAVNGVTK